MNNHDASTGRLHLKYRSFYSMIVGVYFLVALWLLFRVSPISEDGYGAMPTFHWGSHVLSPKARELEQNGSIRFQFSYPYWIAASYLTLLGCGISRWATRLWWKRTSGLFLATCATNFLLVITSAVISDVGVTLHFWLGPRMLSSVYYPWPFEQVLILTSLLSGIVEIVLGHLSPSIGSTVS